MKSKLKKIGMIALFLISIISTSGMREAKASDEEDLEEGYTVCRCHTSTHTCEQGNIISFRRRCICGTFTC
jgi:hypothetical protein